MKSFTIIRDKWLHGEGNRRSCLFRPSDQKQCCLGFYLESCGVPRTALKLLGTPSDIKDIPNEAAWLIEYGASSEDAHSLMIRNDSTVGGDIEREKRITDVFARNGVEVIFK